MNGQLLAQPTQNYSVGFMNTGDFEHSQRVAKMFTTSNLVPKDYQATTFDTKSGQLVRNEQALSNCVIALNMAARIGADPLMVMQNLVIVHNKPTWSSQFLIATFNTCGKYSNLRYEFFGEKGTDEYGCRAVATELSTGEKLVGTDVTIGIAKSEGWYGRNGSKWKTMPQQMLMYRAASWFVRANAPEISMGLHTQDEIIDIEPIDVTPISENVTEEKPVAAKTKKSRSVDTLLGGQPTDEIKQQEPAAQVVEQPKEVPAPAEKTVAEKPKNGLVQPKQPVVEQDEAPDFGDFTPEPPPFVDDMPTSIVGELMPQSMGTMPIPELQAVPPVKPSPVDEWKAKIDSWETVSDVARTLNEMPHSIKEILKPYYTTKNEELRARLIVDVPHWAKRISDCNSREQFMALQKEMPQTLRSDERIKSLLSQREEFGANSDPENW